MDEGLKPRWGKMCVFVCVCVCVCMGKGGRQKMMEQWSKLKTWSYL